MTFCLLSIIGLLIDENRIATFARSKGEWTADIVSLFIQGTVIPAFPFIMVPLLYLLFPSMGGKFELNSFIQFILSFVVIDYLYYWNHRFFHRRNFWTMHRLHHSSKHLDVFATSRNSLITSFMFVYVWVQILAMFLLKDSNAFMIGLGLTYALDLWRHCGLRQPPLVEGLVGQAFIMPTQHIVHHSLSGRNKNFGANFCWWDKLHGTFSNEIIPNKNLERISDKNIWIELIIPWKAKK
jgi:sterol desaturase/sphingolipid hydroxylase (fatty acid hydroxylase superfamily)